MQEAGFMAFSGETRIASGDLAAVAAAARRALDEDPAASILVFGRGSGAVVDLDLRGTPEDVAARYASPPVRGRPKLGVVSREVTLLPRHWDWLARQPGGASVTLRRLVEAASRSEAGAAREHTETAYRFMSTMAGNRPGFEEASRALFAGNRAALDERLAAWPADIAEEIGRLLDP
jgi:hypothetical protein